jgi:hypothetical protein
LPINDTEQLSSLVKTHQCVWIRAAVATASCQDVAGHTVRAHAPGMFVVSEAEAAAIRTAFEQRGEFAAAVELRRLFPGITDNTQARECARTIAGWKSLPLRPAKPAPRLRRVR